MRKAKMYGALLLCVLLLVGCRSAFSGVTGADLTAAETTEVEEGPADSAKFEIVRDDRSMEDGEGNVLIRFYYDAVVLTAPESTAQEINAYIAQDLEQFFSRHEVEGYLEGAQMQTAYGPFYCVCEAAVAHNSGGILSIVMSWDWWMGGVSNHNYFGMTFDLTTGQPLTLADICPEKEQELRDVVLTYVYAEYADGGFADPEGTLAGYTLEQIPFHIADGQIVLTFPVYTFACGAEGATVVKTGIYLEG